MSQHDHEPSGHASTGGYAVLADRTLVRISGPGTDKFVQGQFSQQVDDITMTRSLRAAACTPKGRTYCLTRMVRDGDDLLMDLDNKLAERTLTHLRKYLMLFRGTTMETGESAEILGLVGQPCARELAGERVDALSNPGDVAELDDGYLILLEPTVDGTARYEYWSPRGPARRPSENPELSLRQWQGACIRAGVPWLTPQGHEAYVPQMLNLQHLQGIHFKKGCYTGQEVVARMHFLGQLKKSLYRLTASGLTDAPAPGTRVLADGKNAGEVVNAVMTDDQVAEILAVLRHNSANQPLTLDDDRGTTAELATLPYVVPEQQNASESDT